jgi:RNA 3'-phosphate cyclase
LLQIDGSYMEGGGQILRTAVGLAAATGTACRIFNVRKGRPSPGLAAQHLAGVLAAARLCGADVEGARLCSTELTFAPGRLDPPDSLQVNVGTAGSVTLVLQGLMIPLASAPGPTEVAVSGGTHVKWSPTADYFEQVFCHVLAAMGVAVEVTEALPGFFPKGGGRMRLRVLPGRLRPLTLTHPGELLGLSARSIAGAELARSRVAQRQIEGARQLLEVERAHFDYVRSACPGSAIDLVAQYERCRLGASALGERGRPAERVGREAAQLLRAWMAAGACLDGHMADQVLPYMALAGGRSQVSVAEVTDHCRTNIWVIEQFLPVRFHVDEGAGLIACEATGE